MRMKIISEDSVDLLYTEKCEYDKMRTYQIIESYPRSIFSVTFVSRLVLSTFAVHFLFGKQQVLSLLLLLTKTAPTTMPMLASLFYCNFIFRSNPRTKGAIHSIIIIKDFVYNVQQIYACINTHTHTNARDYFVFVFSLCGFISADW